MDTGQTKSSESPKLAALRERLDSGDGAALESFWREVAEQGAPLVGLVEDDPDHVRVTLVYRDPAAASVSVVGGLSGIDPLHLEMSSLDGTDLWHRSYRVPADVRTVYWFAANSELDDWKTWRHDPLNPRTFVYPADDEIEDDQELVGSLLELSAAPPFAWSERRDGAAAGATELHRLRSEILGNERRV